MTGFANGTKLPIVVQIKASIMRKDVRDYLRLGNNMQIKFSKIIRRVIIRVLLRRGS